MLTKICPSVRKAVISPSYDEPETARVSVLRAQTFIAIILKPQPYRLNAIAIRFNLEVLDFSECLQLYCNLYFLPNLEAHSETAFRLSKL